MKQEIIKALRYFHSPDGPNISINTLSLYCGVPSSTLRDYLSGKCQPREPNKSIMEKGLSDMLKEMLTEWHI